MEKDRSSKIIAIIALVVSIAGLSLGFAAFSNTISITPIAKVEVNKTDFHVVFSKTKLSEGGTPNAGIILPTNVTNGAESKEDTVMSSDGTSISNLGATFNAPGQSATYTFYAANTGKYDAYLTGIVFNDYAQNTGKKLCQKMANADGSITTESLMNAACASITVTVTVGEGANAVTANDTKQTITPNHLLAKDDGTAQKINNELITVVINYPAVDSEGNETPRADGNFEVKFGTIDLVYSSAVTTSNN